MFYYARYNDTEEEMKFLNGFYKDSERLENLNTKIELNFVKNFEILNNDRVTDTQINFNVLLQQLESKLNEYSQKYTNNINLFESEFNEIKNKFESKQKEVKKFNMLKFGIISDIKVMNNYFIHLENNKDYFNIHNEILGFEYLHDKDLNTISKYFTERNPKDKDEKIYVDSAIKVINELMSFSKIYDYKIDNLEKAIFNFKQKVDISIQDIHSHTKFYNLIFVLSLMLFILYSSVLYSIYAKCVARLRNYESILGSLSQPIMITNRNFTIAYANKKAKEIFPNIGKISNFFSVLETEDKNDLFERISRALVLEKQNSYKDRISYMSGTEKHYANIDVKRNNFLNKENYIITLRDNKHEINLESELAERSCELSKALYTDSLTKAGSYILLKQRIANTDGNLIVCLNILNFEDFRILYRSQKIDEIIIKIYDILKQCIDLNQLQFEIYHTWIDEFYLFYKGKDIQNDLYKISSYFAGKHIKLLDNTLLASFKPIFGVSSNNDAPNDRLYQSQIAINEAKKYNKDIAFYDESDVFKKEFERKQKIIKTIQYAIQNNAVIVECQPIFDTSGEDLKVWTYEVLVRIKDQNGEKMSPAEFLQVAKDTSLYNTLSKIVIEKTFALLQRFPENHFSVNLSAIDIVNDELRAFIIENLEKTKNTKNLSIEILETEGAEDYERINHFVHIARQYGCKIAIDDFGSSYSNYYRILAMDIDYIKIDGSIIGKIATDKNAVAVVETIINLAQKQGYDIVAEYTANHEIFSVLKRLGIRYMQGYYLGKPQEPIFLL